MWVGGLLFLPEDHLLSTVHERWFARLILFVSDVKSFLCKVLGQVCSVERVISLSETHSTLHPVPLGENTHKTHV